MNVLNSIFEKEYILSNEHGNFHPLYTFDNYVFNEDEQDYEYIGLVIQKTAQEVYNEWLENKDKPIIQEPTLADKISVLENENKLLKAQVEATTSNQEFLENCLMEMANIVYA